MTELDAFTTRHLNQWLDLEAGPFDEDGTYREELRTKIMRALEEEPDLIDRGFSWREIAHRGE